MSEGAFNKTVGRGAQSRPANRFERVRLEIDVETLQGSGTDLNGQAIEPAARRRLTTEFLPDASQSILSHNDSPDVGFNWSINPYRGCSHGCLYWLIMPQSVSGALVAFKLSSELKRF